MPNSNKNQLLPKNPRSKGKKINLTSVGKTFKAVTGPIFRRRTSKRRTSKRESNNLGKLGPVPVPVNNLTRAPVPEHPILDTSIDEAAAREAASRKAAATQVPIDQPESSPSSSWSPDSNLSPDSRKTGFHYHLPKLMPLADIRHSAMLREKRRRTAQKNDKGSEFSTRSAGKKRDKKKQSQKGKPVKSKNSHKKKK